MYRSAITVVSHLTFEGMIGNGVYSSLSRLWYLNRASSQVKSNLIKF